MGFRRVLTVAVITLALTGWAVEARAQNLEYAVKANYLVRFAVFVEWPATAFPDATAPLTICVAGRDPFGATLDQAAAAQTAQGRRIRLRRLPGQAGGAGCHIVYLGHGAAIDVAPGALVVTDAAVSERRGMIHFVLVSNRVRFHIDQTAARQAGLTMSSRLLNLAVSVRGGD